MLAFIVFTASVASAAVRMSASPQRPSAFPMTTTTLDGSAPVQSPSTTNPSSGVVSIPPVAPHLTSVPKGAYAEPADEHIVDETKAEQVFQALYSVRSLAVFTHDDQTLSLIETGAARTYDVARCHEGCPTPPVTPGTVPHRFSAPAQTSYPAFFAAAVNRAGVRGQPVTEVVIFTRSDASSPWLIALDDSADSSNPFFDETSALGAPVPHVEPPDPRTLPAVLAAYWEHLWATGAPPADNPFFQQPGDADRRQGIIGSRDADAQAGEHNDRRYFVDPHDGVYVVRALADQVLSCGAVRVTDDYTPVKGVPALVQPADRSEFGDGVAPGSYSRIRLSAIEEACFFVAQSGRSVPFEVDPLDYASDATPVGVRT